ncbi:MAG: CoA transferase [Desulfobacterales bacterium]|nr:MAG: CoA transferase [Desulfobacterales bacterium]
MTQPLEGLKVLDFTRVLAGPFATMILGDLGAEVIKAEPPNGDESRSWPPILKKGESGYFLSLNRNKKSITLNLKDPRAKEIVCKLADKVDDLIENFTPGVVKRLGIDYDTLGQGHPGLIYCSISGFGQSGPYRDKRAYDPIIQGMTGIMSITGEKGRSPVKIGIPITDLVAALYAVISIQSAYIYKTSSGNGQYIDVALYDSMVSLLTIMAMQYFATQKDPGRWGLDHIHRVPAKAFKTKDGQFVQVAATNEVMYPSFCKLLGLEELIDDPRFDTNAKRVANRDEIMPLLEERMHQKTRDEWLQLFEEANLPCGPILNLSEVFMDENVLEREMMFTLDHPIEGIIKQLGFPFKFAQTPAQANLRPPLLGEHNEEVLSWLGYSSQEIESFKAEKVI